MAGSKTTTFTFSLVLDGFREPTPEIEDALFESGCDDGLLSFRGPTPILEMDREADSMEDAVVTAIADVQRAGIGARVLRVLPDDLVTAADIARRAGRSREAIRLWIAGERREGDFPPPVTALDTSMLWSWREVADWLARRELIDPGRARDARFLATVNALLDARRSPPSDDDIDRIARRLHQQTGPSPG